MVCAILVGSWFTITGDLGPSQDSHGKIISGYLAFIFTFVLGFLPVALCGAPLYALAELKGKANWGTAAAIGVFPGLLGLLITVTMPLDSGSLGGDIVMPSIFAGAFVSLVTHLLCKRRRTASVA